MSDATAGFSTNDNEEKIALRFCGEYCQSFITRSRAFLPLFSATESLKAVTFATPPSGSEETDLNSHVKSTQLLSVTLSFRNEGSPIHAAMSIYRVDKGEDKLPSGRFIAFFELRTRGTKYFSEFLLTEELQLEKPLPHVRIQPEKEQTRLLAEILREGILRSGLEVRYILSLGVQAMEPVANEADPEDEQFVGLDLVL
jgi:hypothetical protein